MLKDSGDAQKCPGFQLRSGFLKSVPTMERLDNPGQTQERMPGLWNEMRRVENDAAAMPFKQCSETSFRMSPWPRGGGGKWEEFLTEGE